jgi:O-antigen ligase
MESITKITLVLLAAAVAFALYALTVGQLGLACAVMAGATCMPLILRVPVYGMVLLLVSQFVFLGNGPEMSYSKFVYAGLFLACMVLWTPKIVTVLRLYFHEPIIHWTLLLFVMCAASLGQGRIHGVPAVDWLRDFNVLVNYLWIVPAVLSFTSAKDVRRKLNVLTLVGVALTIVAANVYAVLRGFTSFLIPGAGIFLREAEQPWLTPTNTIADSWMLFAFFVPLAMVSVRYRERRGAKGFLLLLAIGAAGTVLSGTRSSLFAIVGGVVFIYFLRLLEPKGATKPKELRAVAIVFGGSAVLLIALSLAGLINASTLLDRMEISPQVLVDTSISNRFTESHDAYVAFRESPIFGQGLGYRLPTVFDVGNLAIAENFFFVHNYYAWVLCKFGIIGVIVWGGFLLSIFRTAVRGFRKATDAFEKEFYGGMAAWLVALAIQSITSSRFNDRGTTAFLGITIGMMLALKYRTWEVAGEPALQPIARGSAALPVTTLARPGAV